MNKEALETLYGLAQQDGYKKSLEEFTILMQQNPEAVNQMYGLARKNGYQKSEDDFNILVGFQQPVKKKRTDSRKSRSGFRWFWGHGNYGGSYHGTRRSWYFGLFTKSKP